MLDACVLLNLLASGQPLSELAEAAEVELFIVLQAAREVQWLDADDPEAPRLEINLEEHVRAGVLKRLTLSDDELRRFVELARVVDDGEATTLVKAEARQMVVATDDRKARRILATLRPQPSVIGTVAIVRAWAAGRSVAEVAHCVRRIQVRASFQPARGDPDRQWWEAVSRSSTGGQ